MSEARCKITIRKFADKENLPFYVRFKYAELDKKRTSEDKLHSLIVQNEIEKP